MCANDREEVVFASSWEDAWMYMPVSFLSMPIVKCKIIILQAKYLSNLTVFPHHYYSYDWCSYTDMRAKQPTTWELEKKEGMLCYKINKLLSALLGWQVLPDMQTPRPSLAPSITWFILLVALGDLHIQFTFQISAEPKTQK